VHGHVLDPRTGEPVARAALAAVVLPGGAEADALSTALLVLGHAGVPALRAHHPGLRALVWP
jgi:thiamine biosynthesis lipoprotein